MSTSLRHDPSTPSVMGPESREFWTVHKDSIRFSWRLLSILEQSGTYLDSSIRDPRERVESALLALIAERDGLAFKVGMSNVVNTMGLYEQMRKEGRL